MRATFSILILLTMSCTDTTTSPLRRVEEKLSDKNKDVVVLLDKNSTSGYDSIVARFDKHTGRLVNYGIFKADTLNWFEFTSIGMLNGRERQVKNDSARGIRVFYDTTFRMIERGQSPGFNKPYHGYVNHYFKDGRTVKEIYYANHGRTDTVFYFDSLTGKNYRMRYRKDGGESIFP